MMSGCWIASALSLALTSAAPETPTLIFLLGGQSNMVGLGEVSRLPRAYRNLPANVAIWEEGGWRPLKPQGETFGPEFGFALAIATALPKERIGLVKHAKSGSWIAEWSADDPQSLFGVLMGNYRAAKEASPGAKPAGMLWMQGERDARQADTAAIYGGKLQELIEASRKAVGEDDLAFLIGHVNPSSQTHPAVNAVRAAQAELPKRMKRVALVSTSGVDKLADNLHYDAKGQIELGRRYARAYLALDKPPGGAPSGKVATPSATADPFARGAVWAGRRSFGAESPATEEWQLTVTERDGDRFKGEVLMIRGSGNDAVYKVEGKAPARGDGLVDFLTEKKGLFQQRYRGKLADGGLDLSFGGTAFLDGSQVSGTATLKPRE